MDWDNELTIKPDRSAAGVVLGQIDQYELLRELGGGGFGTVYLARDTVSGVEVAVKGLPPLVKNNKEELENIRRNFALVSRLTHENIAKALVLHPVKVVTYLDKKVESNLRVHEDDTLMVMDYAPGVTLSAWRKQFPEGKVPFAQTVEIIRQIASALDYAHAQRIVHRDIKPSNIMIESRVNGSLGVSVLDFGLAAEIRSSMSRVSLNITDMSGTRPYMAPEQWQGRRQGEATDQYALAALTYELLTGDVPFASVFSTGDPMVMMNVVGHESPEIPQELPKSVSNALSRALTKRMEERFVSCSEFVKALEGKLKVKTAARDVSNGPCRDSSFMRLVKMLLAVFVFVVVVVGGGAWYWRDMRIKEQKRIEAEHIEFQKLQNIAVELKIRATQAYEDAKQREFEKVNELATRFREFNRHYKAGMEFFVSTNYVAATDAFEKVGMDMRLLIATKKRIDEETIRKAEEERKRKEQEQREAELKRLVGLGYVRIGDKAIWQKGRSHKTNTMLVTDSNPETWRSIKPGWKWAGNDEVKWCPDIEHPKFSNWVSSNSPDKWYAKIGYKPVEDVDKGLPTLIWMPGEKYGDYRTMEQEGVWEKLLNCDKCAGNGRINSKNLCGSCNGNGNVETRVSCIECSGSGRRSVREDCASCTGGTIFQNCQSSCSQVTRNGSVLFQHGFVCSECNGRGQKVNTSGIVGGIVAAGIVGALAGRHYRPSVPQTPTYLTCQRCSGLGGYVCSNCSGTGQTRSTCTTCGGSGSVLGSRRCGICSGEGKVSRMQVCRRCRNGYLVSDVSCDKCKGEGRIWTMYEHAEPSFADFSASLIEMKEKGGVYGN